MAAIKKKVKKSSDSIKTPKIDSDIKSPWTIGPIDRSIYRNQTLHALTSSDHDEAALNDSKVPSCTYVKTYFNYNRHSPTIDEQTIGQTIDLQQKSENDLVDFLAACLNNLAIVKTDDNNSTVNAEKDSKEIKDLYAKCAELPHQWNVVQLSQLYDGHNGYATSEDVLTSDFPIKLTMFRYNECEKRNNSPFNIVLNFNEFGSKSITSTAHEIYQSLYKDYVNLAHTTNYPAFIKNLTEMQSKIVNDLKLWLGPWATLLAGKIKGQHGKEFEKKIFDEVDKFVQERDNFTDDQYMQLSLVARRIDLLDSDKIKQAAHDIAQTEKDFASILQFLATLKSKTKFKRFEYYPCILVVDDILDNMPWEMVLPSQEFSRVHSIYLLFDLYERFKHQIDDGYLKINVKNGFAVINPDNDEKLVHMSERMAKYYDDCLPEWKRIERVVPTLQQLTEALTCNNLFVYSGHGSSLQFFTNEDISNIKHSCLMLLFGCDSIAMKSRGTICEAQCTSYTYFNTGCPGILGAISIVTDVWIDLITMYILTQWVTTKQTKHPVVNACADEHAKERVRKILSKIDGIKNGNLLSLLCDIRNEQDISIRMRSAIVYRGLPPFNSATAIDE